MQLAANQWDTRLQKRDQLPAKLSPLGFLFSL